MTDPTGVAGAHLDLRHHLSYADYLRLDDVLRAQQPRSAAHDEMLGRIREALGDETFGRLWADGAAMSLDQAVAYALEAADG